MECGVESVKCEVWSLECGVHSTLHTSHFKLRTPPCTRDTSHFTLVLQSWRQIPSSTSLYCKACTSYFPVLLCTTKLAQGTPEYYFVLQSLSKVLPSITLLFPLPTSHFTLHTSLQTSKPQSFKTSKPQTRHFTLHTSHFTLRTAHCTPDTAH